MFLSYMFLISLLLFQECTAVNLMGPRYVKRHDSLSVICTTSVPSIGLTAEFLINNKTYTSLRWYNGGCFSATSRAKCPQDTCICSADGRRFSQKIFGATKDVKPFKIMCSMKFNNNNPVIKYDTITVNVLDITGPNIVPTIAFPLNKGTIATLKCIVRTTLDDVRIIWKCIDAREQLFQRQNATILVSELEFEARFSDNGKECKCFARTEYFNSSSSIQLHVLDIPVILIENKHTCKRSSSVIFTCNINEESKKYNFGPWIHSFRGNFVRSLNGNRFLSGSTLAIESCNYQDIGNYTCVLWNKYSEDGVLGNKTTTLTVTGPPLIVDVKIFRSTPSVMSVRFYTSSEQVNIQWYFNGKRIINSTEFDITLSQGGLYFQMHNVTLIESGYTTNLTVTNEKLGTYLLVIQNNYGNISEQFHFKKGTKKAVIDFNTVIWILSCVGVFLITSTVATILIGCRNWNEPRNRREHQGTADYITPAEDISNRTYTTTEPHYEDATNYSSTRQYSEMQPVTEILVYSEIDEDKDDEIHQYTEVM